MIAAFLITFRESLEAALVIGILITYLIKTNQGLYKKYVWFGAEIGLAATLLVGVGLKVFFGGLTGRTEEIFEGTLMFITAGLLAWMILWVHRQKGIAQNLKIRAQKHINKGFLVGLIFLPLTAVLREGVETVFYLQAVAQIGGRNPLLGAALGMALALSLGYVIFRFGLRIDIVKLLKLTGAMLLIFAAGLVAHGVHEFQEAGLLPVFSFDPLIDISGVLANSSLLGSIMRTLFGYTATPTLLELLSYGLFVYLIYRLEQFTNRKLSSKFAKKV